MQINIYTQYRENYGAFDWDGVGECPQYWKFKGGDDYSIPVTLEQAMAGSAALEQLVREWSKCLISNEVAEEYVINWELVDG